MTKDQSMWTEERLEMGDWVQELPELRERYGTKLAQVIEAYVGRFADMPRPSSNFDKRALTKIHKHVVAQSSKLRELSEQRNLNREKFKELLSKLPCGQDVPKGVQRKLDAITNKLDKLEEQIRATKERAPNLSSISVNAWCELSAAAYWLYGTGDPESLPPEGLERCAERALKTYKGADGAPPFLEVQHEMLTRLDEIWCSMEQLVFERKRMRDRPGKIVRADGSNELIELNSERSKLFKVALEKCGCKSSDKNIESILAADVEAIRAEAAARGKAALLRRSLAG